MDPAKPKRLALNVRFASQVKVEKAVGTGTERPKPPEADEVVVVSAAQSEGEKARNSSSLPLGSSPAGRSVTAVAAATQRSSEKSKVKKKIEPVAVASSSVQEYALDDVMEPIHVEESRTQPSVGVVQENVPMLFQMSSTVMELIQTKGPAKFVKRASGKCSIVLNDGTELSVFPSVGSTQSLQLVADTSKEVVIGREPLAATSLVVARKLS